jgi:uncharacterized membrane protein
MITLGHIYILAGLFFGAFALLSLRDRSHAKRVGNTAFWALLSASFLFGSHLSDFTNGILVFALILLGGFGALGVGKPETTSQDERRTSALARGNLLFAPALIIPATALLGTLFLRDAAIAGTALFEARQITLISLAMGVILALLVAYWPLRPPLLAPLQEGRRLADTIGWALLLPQLLASLGAVFALAGVGEAVGDVITRIVPLDTPLAAVIAYCVGMALFTIIMGNAFAAFPVMTAAIGIPFILQRFGGDPAIMGAIGMLAGFCGTLMTPMAANFNLVPAALLELPDRDAVIKAQVPTAIPLLIANTALMYFLVFRF